MTARVPTEKHEFLYSFKEMKRKPGKLLKCEGETDRTNVWAK